MHFVPGQTLFVQLFHERIGVEVLYVPYARFFPDALDEHHRADHSRHACGVGHALHARLLVSLLVLTVVVDVVGVLLAVLNTADAAADRGLAFVVLAEVLRVWQHGLQELQRYDLHPGRLAAAVSERRLVLNLVNTAHADVLDHVEVFQILLAEGHPEASLLDGGIVLHQRLQFLVVQQIPTVHPCSRGLSA